MKANSGTSLDVARGFFARPRMKAVARAAIGYAIIAFALIQGAGALEQALTLPVWFDTVVTVLLFIGFPLAIFLAWSFDIHPDGLRRAAPDAPSEIAASKPARAPAARLPQDERVSIAVLPFVDMSPGKDQDYFSDGLSEELLNQLAQMKDLRVAARTSCFAFKGQNADVKEIGEKLGVANVLEGSVRKAGNKLRITAQLIKTEDGYHLWSNTFDRDLDDVFAIQEDIARAVADALKITLGMNQSTLLPGGTTNLEAYDLYLRARAQMRDVGADSGMRAAALYREAVSIDPNFAIAWAGLGISQSTLAITKPETAEESLRLGGEALERARACAPDALMIHVLEGTQRFFTRDWLGADQAFTKANALSPSTVLLLGADATGAGYPFFLATVGRMSEAVALYQSVLRNDPLSTVQMLQFTLDCAGRHDEAEADYRRARALPVDPSVTEYFTLLRRMARDTPARVKEQFARYLAFGHRFLPLHEEVLAQFDDKAAVLALLRPAFDDPQYQDPSRSNGIGQLAAYFGDDALALACLRRAFVEKKGIQTSGIWHPLFARLRKSDGFKEMVRDLGLYDYWRKSGKWGDFAKPKGGADFEML